MKRGREIFFQLVTYLLLASESSVASSHCKLYDERARGTGKSAEQPGAAVRAVCTSMELRQVLPPEQLPNRTVTLILSNNKIQELKNGSFAGLSTLEKLDIRNNVISHIEPGAFLGLAALKRLDLSNNRIGCLNEDIFKGLPSLTRLYLSGNMFSSLSPGTFNGLVSLKTLEFQTPYLLCDCNLRWVPRWLKDREVVSQNTRCAYPHSLQGQALDSLKSDHFTCDSPLELPSFQMNPSQRQLVFRGDSLPFHCLASYIDQDMQVLWYQDGKMVEPNASMGIFIQRSVVHNCTLITSMLTISNIQPGSTGTWECRVRTSRGNNTRTVPIVVLESAAKYCSAETVSNNKGEFRWPRTLAGLTMHLPCPHLAPGAGLYTGSSARDQQAWRTCDRRGFWAEEDYSRCQYQKDVTRVLYIINQLPLNLTNAGTTARQLLAYTAEAANFSDKMDVIFVAEMIEKFGKFAEKFKELGDVMVDIASNLMLADERVLWLAQREARACSRIVECLQSVAGHGLSPNSQAYSTTSPNIALEAHAIKACAFNGMTCTLFQKLSPDRPPARELAGRDPDLGLDRQLSFKCNVTSNLSSLALKNTVVEASLQLPPSRFSQASGSGTPPEDTVHKLYLLAFRNSKLFPSAGNSSDGKRRTVATPVILAKIDGFPLRGLRSPVNATLRRHTHGSDVRAAYWNFSLLGGLGGWALDGCRVLRSDENFTTISCDSLNNYAVLVDLSGTEYTTTTVRLLHPVVYTSAIVLQLCLLAVIVSYIYHHKSVRISRKSWHMLLNLCLHILLACTVFIGGINQTRHASVCQAVGIVLHYSTLATVLWVGVTARNIYKQVTRKAKRYEELDEPPPAPRPMLRFYLIGGGIPTIVCGITAAANIKNYGSRANAPYCWMAWEPSLGAFYGPVGFMALVDCLYFLSILIQLRRHPERRYELKEPSEEQQRLAGGAERDYEDREGGSPAPALFSASVSHGDLSAVPPAALENEQTFPAQLLGAALTLALFAALWGSAALAVSQERPLDLLFSCLFAVAALSLGAFLVAHHCVTREDVRLCWVAACCHRRRDYTAQVDTPPSANGNGEVPKCPNSSAESSCTNKSGPSLKNPSSQGCKLTNLQAEAAQCKPLPLPVPALSNGVGVPPDNSLTEHSLDTEIKMHVVPVEVPFRPNGHVGGRHHPPHPHHRSRARAHRASRLTVLREYAHDVPTSVDGSVQGGHTHRSRHPHDGHTRSRRAAYLAYRERRQSLQQQDSSDASITLPRRSRALDKGDGASGAGPVGRAEPAAPPTSASSKDCVKQPVSVELDGPTKCYGLNLASQNGQAKDNACPASAESSGNIRTGLWKHETTV
ncbi:adhesion G protein-coupled receptor A3 [Brienomyrus brachyistius]|uniref:adhesion G protein-coupled receptor A3 n=1 Tax=Brienomyrus brachyistius TaxID=42636 RepID=UPI0020B23A64|nr:adhesion G protein-coupled receptor A3 [Brienomyrus brachyistius]